MKTPSLVLILAATLPFCATAAPPQPAAIAIDCAHRALPSQQDMARITGVSNFTQLYAVRQRLMQQVNRECHRGAGQVMLVQDLRQFEMPPSALAEARR